MVYQVVKTVNIPIVGIGGIMDYKDALEFIIAGASAVQIGTANFIDPYAPVKILEGIRKHCIKKGITNINDLKGSLKVQSGE